MARQNLWTGLLQPVARGASRFGKLLARLADIGDKIITYWTKACDIPTTDIGAT